MDNKISSILKRSLKVITSYIVSFIIFCIFGVPAMYFGQGATPAVIPWLSFGVFCVLFFSLYIEMRNFAHKEKRPQYNLNPLPYKGLLYGIIGVIPLFAVQALIIFINVPQDYEAFRRRMYQLFSGPLYWLAKILGNGIPAYMTALLALVLTAFLGYWAGHRDFYLVAWLREKLGIKKAKKAKR